MKVGDLVEHELSLGVGVVTKIEHAFNCGGGGAWAASEVWYWVFWPDAGLVRHISDILRLHNESR